MSPREFLSKMYASKVVKELDNVKGIKILFDIYLILIW